MCPGTRACFALVLVACLGGLAACGENASQREARQTVDRFYDALKRHDARTACALVSPAVADSLVRASGAAGKPCVARLQLVFRRVASGSDPHRFDSVPHTEAATIRGNRATVVISRGYQRRHVNLVRAGDRWQITGSADVP